MKKRAQIESWVKVILCDVLLVDEEQLVPLARLDADLGADSLDRAELWLRLEELMWYQMDEDDFDKCVTVQDVINLVASAKAKA